ncbi:MAG: LytR/AlgR family response regulator transcription factor [Salibacteraceae bacterium]
MKVLIVDDEPDALDNLEIMLSDWTEGIEVVGRAQGVATGVKKFRETQPDIIFLDIEMPDGNGFELLAQLPTAGFHVIFVTSHDRYMLRALRLAAIDFLLKPINPVELQSAVQRAQQKLNEKDEHTKRQVLQENLNADEPSRLVVSDKNNIYLIEISDLLYCKGEGNYTTFYLREESPVVISKTLKTYEKLLLDEHFFRVHNSYIVNLKAVKRIEKGTSDRLVMRNGDKVPIATRRKSEVIQLLTQ